MTSCLQQQAAPHLQLPPDEVCYVKKFTNLDAQKHNSQDHSAVDENAKEDENELSNSILMSDYDGKALEETPNAIFHQHW